MKYIIIYYVLIKIINANFYGTKYVLFFRGLTTYGMWMGMTNCLRMALPSMVA